MLVHQLSWLGVASLILCTRACIMHLDRAHAPSPPLSRLTHGKGLLTLQLLAGASVLIVVVFYYLVGASPPNVEQIRVGRLAASSPELASRLLFF